MLNKCSDVKSALFININKSETFGFLKHSNVRNCYETHILSLESIILSISNKWEEKLFL